MSWELLAAAADERVLTAEDLKCFMAYTPICSYLYVVLLRQRPPPLRFYMSSRDEGAGAGASSFLLGLLALSPAPTCALAAQLTFSAAPFEVLRSARRFCGGDIVGYFPPC